VHGARSVLSRRHRAACATPSAPLLVTTPVHLRALVESDARCRRCAASSRPPRRCRASSRSRREQRFGCEVREVFGSTETCVIARRRTARE
jgi:acyl-coenzyme A synthetase/AMP-(fatty) acid ligase